MPGSGLGFVLNQPALATSGSGPAISYTPDEFEYVETVAFAAGALVITLPNPPVPATLNAYYNGIELRPGAGGYTLSGSDVTVDFSDDPTIYDNGEVVFYFRFWYT